MKIRWRETGIFALLLVITLVGTVRSTEVDRLSALLPKFEQYIETTRESWKVPGLAVAIVVKDKVVYSQGFGVKEVGRTEKVDPHTIFQIGSASKAFTSALVAMQVDEKKFAWKDKVIDHLPDFRMKDPWVTREFQIEDLMAQHSGLAPYSGDIQAFLGFDRPHIIHSLRYLPPVSSFRSEFAYQNHLFLVAAALVEKSTGMSWEKNIETKIFQPLVMTESTTSLKDFQATENLAIPHTRQGDRLIPLGKDWPFQQGFYTYGPAGGINSNVIDMAKWLRLHLRQGKFAGRQLISAENLAFVHSPHTIIKTGGIPGQTGKNFPLLGIGTYYAQGWVYAYANPDPIVWHNGGTSGYKSVVAFVPKGDVGIVILSNLAATQVPEILAQWFFDHYFGTADTDWNRLVLEGLKKSDTAKESTPKTSSPALAAQAYVGTYHNDIYGDINVREGQGKLILTIGPKKLETFLTHVDRDTFQWEIPNSYQSATLAEFEVTSKQAETLTLEVLNPDGSGVFQRMK